SIDTVASGDEITPTFSGSSSNTDGDLTLTVNGVDYVVTPEADGSWEFTLPDGAALEDGTYTAAINGSDAQNNEAPEDSTEFTVDQLPIVSIDTVASGDDITPTFSGTSSNTDGDLTLTVNGVDYVVTPEADGSWEFILPDDAALEDGTYTAAINGSDAQNNEAPEASTEFTVDQLPIVSIDTVASGDEITPTFSGSSSNTDGDLTLTVNGVDYVVTPEADGSWEFTLPDGAALEDGTYTAAINGSDAQNNEAPEDSTEFTVDQLPIVSIDTVASGDDITPTFSGTSSNTDGDLTLTVNGVDYVVTPEADGSWEFILPDDAALEDGTYTAAINGSDAQNNDAPEDSASFRVLLTPEVSITVTNDPEDTTPTFSGTSDNTVGDLTLTVNGVEYAVTPELDGSWEFTLPDGAALADGDYTATIDGVDAQGDAAETSDADFTIGLVPEVSITVTNDPEDTTPTFSGTSDNTVGDLTLTVNGVEYAVTPELDGSWEFTLPDGAALADGDYTATIDGVDAQGDAAETSDADFTIGLV
ncbi:Ig-like domain-containing protein, partial [Echinimonas agarilytica]